MTEGLLSLPQVDLAYRSEGQGDCVILIHALATSQILWERQVCEMGKSCRLVSFDLRGHGHSSIPQDNDYSFEALAHDVVELMDYLDIERADLVGISVGGEVAQVAAATYTTRFRRLVLSSTACYTAPARAAAWEERIADAGRSGMRGIAAATARRWFSPRFADQNPAMLRRYEELIAATPLTAYQNLARVIQRMDLRPLISGMSIPTLVVCGELDGNTGPPTARMMTEAIPHAKMEIIAGVGHFPNLESPDEFLSLCSGFLDLPKI